MPTERADSHADDTRRELTERLDHLRASRLQTTNPANDEPTNLRFLASNDADVVPPPTDQEIDALLHNDHDTPEIETDTIDALQSFWVDERRLNANRIWESIDNQLDDTPQTYGRIDGIRRRSLQQGSPFTRTVRHWRSIAAAAGVAAAMIIGSVALPFHDGARTSSRSDGGRTAASAPRPDRPIPIERVVRPDTAIDSTIAEAVTALAAQVDDLSIFTHVALEDGTLSSDEQVSIEQRVDRIAAAITNDDGMIQALGLAGVETVVAALTDTSSELTLHTQADDAPVAASAASIVSVAQVIEESGAAIIPPPVDDDVFVAAIPANPPASSAPVTPDVGNRQNPQTLSDLLTLETTPGPAATHNDAADTAPNPPATITTTTTTTPPAAAPTSPTATTTTATDDPTPPGATKRAKAAASDAGAANANTNANLSNVAGDTTEESDNNASANTSTPDATDPATTAPSPTTAAAPVANAGGNGKSGK